jgi:RNA polymerase sigma-70 factor (ECF subfamily)
MRRDHERSGDEGLVAAVAAGDADAMTALYRRRNADVYRFALHMTGSSAAADDVTQDVFLVVMRDARRFVPGRSTVASWLLGIARNCARQWFDRARTFRHDAPGDVDPTSLAVCPDPVGDLARAERIARLRRAVLALPVRYREVVVLCDLQELSYAEAADILGCAIGTIRSRLHRARALLAAKLEPIESAEHTRTSRLDGVEAESSSALDAVLESANSVSKPRPAIGRTSHKRCLA